jgi:hypothetical protein
MKLNRLSYRKWLLPYCRPVLRRRLRLKIPAVFQKATGLNTTDTSQHPITCTFHYSKTITFTANLLLRKMSTLSVPREDNISSSCLQHTRGHSGERAVSDAAPERTCTGFPVRIPLRALMLLLSFPNMNRKPMIKKSPKVNPNVPSRSMTYVEEIVNKSYKNKHSRSHNFCITTRCISN